MTAMSAYHAREFAIAASHSDYNHVNRERVSFALTLRDTTNGEPHLNGTSLPMVPTSNTMATRGWQPARTSKTA